LLPEPVFIQPEDIPITRATIKTLKRFLARMFLLMIYLFNISHSLHLIPLTISTSFPLLRLSVDYLKKGTPVSGGRQAQGKILALFSS
jgi:hypothetical protein